MNDELKELNVSNRVNQLTMRLLLLLLLLSLVGQRIEQNFG